MKYYKDSENNVYFFTSDQQMKQFAKVPLTAITDAEKDALLAPPPETQEQTIARYEAELDNYVDQVAQDRGYKNIDSVGKYLTVGNPFEAEAKALSLWTGEVYATAFAMLQQFKAGEIDQPTLEEVITALPTPPAT